MNFIFLLHKKIKKKVYTDKTLEKQINTPKKENNKVMENNNINSVKKGSLAIESNHINQNQNNRYRHSTNDGKIEVLLLKITKKYFFLSKI